MPGTTSNAMPWAASACISSPPRPKMNGSPPLSRTTCLALACQPHQQGVDLFLPHGVFVAPFPGKDALGTWRREREHRRRYQVVGRR